jgi:hypothetical protein
MDSHESHFTQHYKIALTSPRYTLSARTLTPSPESALVTCRVAECAAAVRDAFVNSGVWFELVEGIAGGSLV